MIVDDHDRYPIYKTLTEHQPAPIVDDSAGDGSAVYYGYAPIGTDPAKPQWKIILVEVVGNITTTKYADGNMNYDNVWDDRASLTYIR